MTVDESVALLERLLAETSFGPAELWELFRDWAYRPVACERDELEVSLGHEDGTTWIAFRRDFEDAGTGIGEEIVLRLSTSRPDAPRLAETGEFCDDRSEVANFFARVENLPGFCLALAYPHWQFTAERGEPPSFSS